MKITDEEIKQIAVAEEFKLHDGELKPYVYGMARRLIAKAQEVKQLELRSDRPLSCYAYVETGVGRYEIDDFDSGLLVSLERVCVKAGLQTNKDACQAVQDDYAKRVLAGLKYGGVSDDN